MSSRRNVQTEGVESAGIGSQIAQSGPMRSYRVLFVASNHLPYIGGAEFSTHHMARALVERGHKVSVLAGLTRRSFTGLADMLVSAGSQSRPPVHTDKQFGYPTVRCIRPLAALRSCLDEFKPDVVVVTGSDPGLAVPALMQTSSYPSILYFRIGAPADFVADIKHFDLAIANSKVVADRVRVALGRAEFLPSVFPPELYRVPTTREKVLFVNPIPKKGVEIALYLAQARPDIPFVFSLSWRMKSSSLRSLRRVARRLRNVEIRRATIRPEALYRDCRLVLVPSQSPEGWPRVVSEAQINGIPTLASNVEGLPDPVGPGGVLVDPNDSKEAWLDSLGMIWDDVRKYEELSQLALWHSQRPDLAVPAIVTRFEALVRQAIEEHARCDAPTALS